MFFDKKSKELIKCEGCGKKTEKKHSFCPFCGNNFLNSKKEREDFGLLGKNDFSEQEELLQPQQFGMMDKILNSMVNSMMKNLDKQLKDQFKDMEDDLGKPEIRSMPSGIKIKISGPFDINQRKRNPQARKQVRQEIGEEQLKKITKLPRAKAKTNVKRFGDKIIYELATPGVASPQDVFVSKLESGYEIKVIGDKKVYVNNVPINLPMKKYTIAKDKLLVEFFTNSRDQ